MQNNLFDRNSGKTYVQTAPQVMFENEVAAMQRKTDKLVAMLNEEVNVLKKQISEIHNLMGESFFEYYKKLEDNDMPAKMLLDNKQHVEKIEELQGAIKNKEVKINELNERLNDEIAMLKQLYSKENESGLISSYTPNNDVNIETRASQSFVSNVVICSKCGMKHQSGFDNFCTECGNRL